MRNGQYFADGAGEEASECFAIERITRISVARLSAKNAKAADREYRLANLGKARLVAEGGSRAGFGQGFWGGDKAGII